MFLTVKNLNVKYLTMGKLRRVKTKKKRIREIKKMKKDSNYWVITFDLD